MSNVSHNFKILQKRIANVKNADKLNISKKCQIRNQGTEYNKFINIDDNSAILSINFQFRNVRIKRRN